MVSVFIFASLFIVVGNLLIIVLFVLDKAIRKKSLFLVINMAFAHLMLGALSIPLYTYFIGADYRLWTRRIWMPFDYLFFIIDSLSMGATLITAASISGERLYAIHWPFKHRTLSLRAYRIVMFTVWALALLETAAWFALYHFTSDKYAFYVWTAYTLIPTFIICGCNIGIFRKFQQGGVALHREKRDVQNKRLTKTLLFVSVLALLSWLPLIILNFLTTLDFSIPLRHHEIATILNYSNSFVNPIVYALRIPEFRQALSLCCLGRDATMNDEGVERRNKAPIVVTRANQLKILRTDPGHRQLAFEPDFMDSEL